MEVYHLYFIQHKQPDLPYMDYHLLSDQVKQYSLAFFHSGQTGSLYSFLAPAGLAMSEKAQHLAGILPKGEYEAMYADEVNHRLYILCKDCSIDNAIKRFTGYTLTMNTGTSPKVENSFQANVKAISAKSNKREFNFRPSALAKNKLSNNWYILSSVNKLLVIMDDQWKVKEVFELDLGCFFSTGRNSF